MVCAKPQPARAIAASASVVVFQVPLLFYSECMNRVALSADTAPISQAILEAPGWARLGITAPSPRMREQAATELARSIAARLCETPAANDGRQLAFEL